VKHLAAIVLALVAVSADAGAPGRGGGLGTCPRGFIGGGLVPCTPAQTFAFFEFAPAPNALGQQPGMTAPCACAAVTGAKGEVVTWTRGSTATCTKSASESSIANGDLVTCAANLPRVMSLGGPLGVLVESSRTNSALQSEAFDNAVWGVFNVGTVNPTVTANAATAPNGAVTAERVQVTATTAVQSSFVFQTVSTAGVSAHSVYLQGNGGSGTTDVCTQTGSYACTSCSFVSTSWTRCVVISSGAVTQIQIGNMSSLNGGIARSAVDFFVFGDQLELGPYATSYNPTTTVAVTRAADVASVLLSGVTPATSGCMGGTVNFASHWWSGSPGSDSAVANLTIAVNAVGAMNYLQGSTTFGAFSGAAAAIQTISITPPNISRYAIGWTGTSVSSYFNGATASGTWTAPLNTQLTLQLGDYNGGHELDNVLSLVKYDPSPTRCQ
jgi:hypothetical protein